MTRLLLLLLLLGCCLGAVVEQRPDGSIGISVLNKDSGRVEEVVVDALLVATGRRPNVSGMGLDQAGVKFNSCVTSPSSLWASCLLLRAMTVPTLLPLLLSLPPQEGRRDRGRQSQDERKKHLCCRRRLLRVQVHPRRRLPGADGEQSGGGIPYQVALVLLLPAVLNAAAYEAP